MGNHQGHHQYSASGPQNAVTRQESLVPEPPPERIVLEMRSDAFGVTAQGLNAYKDTIVGSEIADWMTGQLWCASRQRAKELGQLLINAGYLQMVQHDSGFADDASHLYRFTEQADEAHDGGEAHDYDIAVIGAGAAGLAAAALATKLGARVALIEQRLPGGDNVWTASVPSKTLLQVAKHAHIARTSSHMGVQVSNVRVDMTMVRAHISKVQNEVFKESSPAALAKLGVEVIHGHAAFAGPNTIEINLLEEDNTTPLATLMSARSSLYAPAIAGVQPASSLSAFTRGRTWSSVAKPPTHAIGIDTASSSRASSRGKAIARGSIGGGTGKSTQAFTAEESIFERVEQAETPACGPVTRPVVPPLHSSALDHIIVEPPADMPVATTSRRKVKSIRAAKIIIATGSKPDIPDDIEGLADVPYFTSDSIFENATLPRRLVVIGGGPTGCEVAQAYSRLGSEVTIIAPSLLPQEDSNVRDVLRRVFYKERILHVVGHVDAVEYDDSVLSPSQSRVGRSVSNSPICTASPVTSNRSPAMTSTDGIEAASSRASFTSPMAAPLPAHVTSRGSFSGRLSVGGPEDLLPAAIKVYCKGEVYNADMLFVGTGRTPVLSGLQLEKAGLTADTLNTNHALHTRLKHVFVAGDATGQGCLAHLATFQGFNASRNALMPGNMPGWPDVLPRVVYTDPEVATVGLTPSAALEKYGPEKVRIVSKDNEEADRAHIDGDVHGFLSLAVLKDGSIAGATVVGARASETAAEISLAMSGKLKVQDIALAVHPYPTSSSMLQQVAAAAATDTYVQSTVGRAMNFVYRGRAGSAKSPAPDSA